MDPIRQTNVIGCRFCFEPTLVHTDPLITPCKCTGSVRYIHLQCLKQWRRATTNPDFIRRCQLCLTNYKMPLRHPLEHIPLTEHDQVWFFLSKPYMPIFLCHYFYIIIAGHILKEKILAPPHSYLFPYVPLNFLSNLFFFSMSSVVFACYGAYYMKFLRRVKNKELYAKHWLSISLDGAMPLPYATTLLLSYSMTQLCIYPFGFCFILLLPKFMNIHKTILNKINHDAEL
jgi:RING-variant domain